MDSGYSGYSSAGYNQPPQYNPHQPYPPQDQYNQNYSQYPPGPQYQGGQNYGPGPNYPQGPHYGFGPSKRIYGPQTSFNPSPNFNQPPNFQNRQIPDSAHMHPLFQEPSYKDCKVCKRNVNGGLSYVCRDCNLVLCWDCFNNIFYGNKQKQIHPHPLALRVRPAWICDICQRSFRETASFYCKPCDFDACSMCYVGF